MPHSYSPSTKGWYIDTLTYPALPDDLVPVSDEEYAKWLHDSSLLIEVQGDEVVMVAPPPPPPPPAADPAPADPSPSAKTLKAKSS
jgi:hypothetical protein